MLIVVNNINLHNNIFNPNNLFIGFFYMSKNTYMNLFGNQEICLIFVKYKTNDRQT
jgi:hypothetical protein